MPVTTPTLHLLCGKIASGKSTLAAELVSKERAVLIAEDDWLSGLFGDEMTSIADYVRCTSKLRQAMGPHIVKLLNAGLSVVLDFQANTVQSRAWMRSLLDQTEAAHQLHFLDVSNETCLARLKARNAAGDHRFAPSEKEFRQITAHFVAPTIDEGFEIVHHPVMAQDGRNLL